MHRFCMGIVNRYENIGKKAKFYTFSEYNNEVASRLIYNTNSTEFSFLCCTLSNYTDLVKKLEHYENITCNLRSKGYDEYYTGALIQTLELEIEGKFFCKKDISIFRDEEIDGVNYAEMVCYLEPNDNFNSIIEKSDEFISYNPDNTNLCGYDEEDTVSTPEIYKYNITETTPGSTADYNEFNSIIVFFKRDNIDIPLGIYILPADAEPIKKYTSAEDAYGQGTSYSLKISMRFASSKLCSTVIPDSTVGDEVSFLSVLDKMNIAIDKMMEMTSKFNDFSNTYKEKIDLLNSLN